MEFEKSSLCRVMVFHFCTLVGNLVFQKMIEAGNLLRAGRAWEKTGQKPKTPPRWGGASILSAQDSSIRQTVKCFPNMSGIIKLPPTN